MKISSFNLFNNIRFAASSQVKTQYPGYPEDSFSYSEQSQISQLKSSISIKDMEDIASDILHFEFKYPQTFKNRIMQEKYRLGDWEISTGKFFIENQMNALSEKYGIKNLVPFATADKSNFIACFVADNDGAGRVVEFDAFADPNELNFVYYDSFEEWALDKV